MSHNIHLHSTHLPLKLKTPQVTCLPTQDAIVTLSLLLNSHMLQMVTVCCLAHKGSYIVVSVRRLMLMWKHFLLYWYLELLQCTGNLME